MTGETRLEYDRLPPIMPSYLRAVTTLSNSLSADQTIPAITAELPDFEVQADALSGYCRVCGFEPSPQLPVTYPHVLAFPMHMAVMTHRDFPLKLLGLIHVRNEITQQRTIDANEKLHIEVSVGGHRVVDKGIEFDLVTRVHDTAGELIWDEIGTMLSRRNRGTKQSSDGQTSRSESADLGFVPTGSAQWRVPADIGRRYAAVAGDYNPIHLSAASAKLFGFPHAIATGMWVKARVAAELMPKLAHTGLTLQVQFKKPVFLPGTTRFAYALHDHGADFALTDKTGDIQHVLGKVSYI